MPSIQASSSSAQVLELQPVRQNTSSTLGDADCIICHDSMQGKPMNADVVGKARLSDIEPNAVVETECKHRFHMDCISTWGMEGPVDSRSSCPTCRAPNDKLLSNLSKLGKYVEPIAHPEQVLVRMPGETGAIPLTRTVSPHSTADSSVR